MLYENEYPITDDSMYYDKEEHMYILTKDYVFRKTGIDLTLYANPMYVTDVNLYVNGILRAISNQIYSFVYDHNEPFSYYQEYLMAKSPLARENIRKALLLQVQYVQRNGKLNEFAGTIVSFNSTNAFTPREELAGARAIHPEAITALNRTLECGEKLLYSGEYDVPNGFNEIFRRGY